MRNHQDLSFSCIVFASSKFHQLDSYLGCDVVGFELLRPQKKFGGVFFASKRTPSHVPQIADLLPHREMDF
jgi:hypothetical protein